MTKSLEERLRDARTELGRMDSALLRHSGRVPSEVGEQLRKSSAFATDIEHWIGMIAARSAARVLLTGLEAQADDNDNVLLGAARVKFEHVRLIGVQAYLATKWALADRIVGMVGQVLCIRSSLNDPKNLPQLVSHFIGAGTKTRTAAVAYYSLRQTFGWPIAVSYALRNHFVHEGGQLGGAPFFEGQAAHSAFAISQEGWVRVEETARSHGVDSTHHRVGPAWPSMPRDDLRVVLDVCERETDDALGVLVGSASRALLAHVGCLVGED